MASPACRSVWVPSSTSGRSLDDGHTGAPPAIESARHAHHNPSEEPMHPCPSCGLPHDLAGAALDDTEVEVAETLGSDAVRIAELETDRDVTIARINARVETQWQEERVAALEAAFAEMRATPPPEEVVVVAEPVPEPVIESVPDLVPEEVAEIEAPAEAEPAHAGPPARKSHRQVWFG